MAASALVLLVAGGARFRDRAAPGAAVASASAPTPLPIGAPERAPVPVTDEATAGCRFDDDGFGDYERWRALRTNRIEPVGRILVPANGRGITEDGSFSMLVHFHGADAARKLLAAKGYELVIAAFDAGIGSGKYERLMADPGCFEDLVAAAERAVAEASGRPGVRARRVALSSWSAGYGAVAQLLGRPHDPLRAIVLLDSLHAGYPHGKHALEHGQLAAFVQAARAASEGAALLYMTHSSVVTEGYASTSETADFLVREIGGRMAFVQSEATEPMQLEWTFERGSFFVRGYSGGDKDAHCAQLHLLGPIVRDYVLPALAR